MSTNRSQLRLVVSTTERKYNNRRKTGGVRGQFSEMMTSALKVMRLKCPCTMTSRVFRDEEGYYLRCLDCGQRLVYEGPLRVR